MERSYLKTLNMYICVYQFTIFIQTIQICCLCVRPEDTCTSVGQVMISSWLAKTFKIENLISASVQGNIEDR